MVLAWGLGERFDQRLPPGSRGLPLVGETLEFFTASPTLELLPFFKRRLERYGPIFRTSVVGEDLIVSLDPELSRRALQEEERAFQIWYPPSFLRVLGADSTVSALGPLHRHIRALVLRLFGPESLRLVLLRDVPRSARAELRSWLRRPGPGVEVRAATSRTDSLLHGYLLTTTTHHPAQMIFGVTEKKLISHDVRRGGRREPVEVLRRVHHGPAGVPAPRSRHSLLPMHAGTQEGDGNAEAAARRAQEQERARARATRPRPSASPRSSSSLTDSPEALQELTEEHENIQKRRADPDSDDEVTWEEYKSMKFTSHVIHEALRLANIAPVVFRKTTQDVQMKEYTVPQGSKVMICSAAAHLNPKVYKNPTVFNPWRWKLAAQGFHGLVCGYALVPTLPSCRWLSSSIILFSHQVQMESD
uniref:Uncharacterized protein n=1 Tax=Zea mays TaxID=4577 RepID=A0A804M1P9_MAIZE